MKSGERKEEENKTILIKSACVQCTWSHFSIDINNKLISINLPLPMQLNK